MRPALLRLLKRPSTLSLLNDLNSAAAGIEQLSVTGQCTACRPPWKDAAQYRTYSSVTEHSTTSKKLRFHDILRPDDVNAGPPHALEEHDRMTADDDDRASKLFLNAESMEYESDLGHMRIVGSRLLDDPRRNQDLGLWKEILRYRKRHYGDQGVIDIFYGLVSRMDNVRLPHDGEVADFFWRTFIDVGLRDDQFLDRLAIYAEDIWAITGRRWGAFYPSVVGGLLAQGSPVKAVDWHRKLYPFHLEHANDIVLLLDAALSCEPQQPPAGDSFSAEAKTLGFRHGLRAFGEICRATPGHKIFEPLINTMLSRGYLLDALYMSDFLIKQGDLPSDATLVEKLLFVSTDEQDNFSRRTRARLRQIRAELQSIRDNLPAPSDNLEEVPSVPPPQEHKKAPEQNETAWIKEKTFRDEFGARLFATKALSVDTITNGLQMFGVTSIGPLSLKEMAVRADGPKDILEKMRTLRDAGVTIRDCAFSRVLEKLAVDNKDIVLEDFLHSDQHPDVLEDVTLQEEFLCSYMVARDWRLYNMTKAILSDIAKDDLDNIQFRALIAAGQWSTAATIVDKMYLDGNAISTHSISYMMNLFLVPRVKGKHPSYAVDREVDEVFYAERILKMALKMQTRFNPKYWVELLIRLGTHRHDQWERIRKLCLWLAHHYGAKDSPILQSISRSSGVDQESLLTQRRKDSPRIFNPRLQMALVSWGFKLSLWDMNEQDMPDGNGQSVLRWVRGLILLRDLERMGIQMHSSFIRQACRERLQVLYGQDRYSDRSWNRTFRHQNPFKLSHVLGDILKVWPTLLTAEEIEDIHTFIDRPMTAFQARQLVSKHEYEWYEQWRNA
ncbi:hypothetical protein PISL3812_00493 [Talaromyces islandicus]|uniref:Pentatricopeptide repeat domain-containing protein n=1 Tax=Talaromyces islandicus TaxID=28573 RepID=A0A0U1LJK1_TALIS|nr:hypothetical protein PISL3812_00493 [Talaromyces islandicus]